MNSVGFGQKEHITPEIFTKIKQYSKANLGVSKTLLLLQDDFPNNHLETRQIANAIAKTKQGNNTSISQAAQLLIILQEHQRDDNCWFIGKDIEEESGHL
jgi:hypothetical protein